MPHRVYVLHGWLHVLCSVGRFRRSILPRGPFWGSWVGQIYTHIHCLRNKNCPSNACPRKYRRGKVISYVWPIAKSGTFSPESTGYDLCGKENCRQFLFSTPMSLN